MTASIDNLPPGQQSLSSASATKPLWAAVGILGFAVLAMGGTMLYNQRAPAPAASVAALTSPTPAVPAASLAPSQGAGAQFPAAAGISAAPATAADDLIEKPSVAPAKPAPVPARKVVKPVHKETPAPSYSAATSSAYPGASRAPSYSPAPVCGVCGSVESVTPVERSSKAPGVGVGAVAGGVLGAVLGNQVGHGNGRTAATVLGAVGGGFAGNAIEGKIRKETVYQVSVRMEDGSRRSVELARAPPVGSQVTVAGAALRTRDGVSYGPKPPPAPVSAQPAFSPEYQGR
ncbi:glycine zipper 2TM domain-containing protein [Polaromonas sp.]|uniref:glycine zipper 2TM domain-containing protein n=1 Tax=Polaromonas sp. TaxID=1869339 RepID=UPI0017C80EB5|nr:glycine zipper 2TM domain-containing protein [Polaromonas sp.]NMM08035.1 glycine zipper 2TM domain-containing protein [Polaromonas sp.]